MYKFNSNNYASLAKLIGTAFLCVVLAIAMVWPTPSRAQTYTVAELRALLNEILIQLNQLQGVGVDLPSGICPYIWQRDLGRGSTGPDVLRLQQFLNASSDTRLAVSGAGSPGMETQYYGPITAAAVSSFQAKYRSEILTPIGLVNPTGYFGAMSRAKANDMCATPPVSIPGDDGDDDDGDLEGGAGTISDAELVPGISNEEVGEGEDNVDVLGLELTAGGSDIELRAITIDFDPLSGTDDNFDDYAEEVSIWLDGEEYATVEADEFEDDDGHQHTVTLDGGAIIREDDMGELVIAVSGVNNLDSEDEGDRWDVRVDSVRFGDAQNAVITDTSMDDLSREFRFVEFATAADLGFAIRSGDDEINDARSIEVSNDDTTDNIPVLSFVVETEGESDLDIEDLQVSIDTTGGDVDDVVSAAYLYMDGSRVGSESITGAVSDIVFDNVDLELQADETYEFEVRLDFEEANGTNYSSGATVDVDVTAEDRDAWNVEDEQGDDVDDSDRRGSASADAHTLVTEGATLTLVSSETTGVYNSANPSASYGQFRMVIDVEAIGETIYVAETATRDDMASATVGATYYFQDGSGNEYSAGTGSQSFSRVSGGSMENGFVRISEGQTARFELVATLDPAAFGQYRAQLVSIGWNDTATTPDSTTTATPASNYRTSLQTISD